VDGEWGKAKVDVICNHPLTEEQKSKIVEAAPQAGEPGNAPG
jgi:F0F1-type ATP synthase delta subunit